MELIKEFIKDAKCIRCKIAFLSLFIILFTGSDLLVKQIAKTKLEGKEPVVVIKGFWSFYYVINDDIGFSLLHKLDKYLKYPAQFKASDFENKVLDRLSNQDQQALLEYYQKKDSHYLLKKNLSGFEYNILDYLFKKADYHRTLKWIFLVLLQGLGTIIVIIFYFSIRDFKQLIPLALIVGGALGNVTDRIIRGYVVDFIWWYYKDFSWPIFNLADVYTVIGAVCLLFILIFFKENDQNQNDAALNGNE